MDDIRPHHGLRVPPAHRRLNELSTPRLSNAARCLSPAHEMDDRPQHMRGQRLHAIDGLEQQHALVQIRRELQEAICAGV